MGLGTQQVKSENTQGLPFGNTANRLVLFPTPVLNQLYANTQNGIIEVFNGTIWVSTGLSSIVQGGNSFAAPMVIGTNDANPIEFETNGATRLVVDNNGINTRIRNPNGRLQIAVPNDPVSIAASFGPGGNELFLGVQDNIRFQCGGATAFMAALGTLGLNILSTNGISLSDNYVLPVHGTSTVVEIIATNKGVLIPRITTAARNAIPNPQVSLLIFNSDIGQFQTRTATGWVSFVTNNAIENLGNAQLNLAPLSTRANVDTFQYGGQSTATMNAAELVINSPSADVANFVALPIMIGPERSTTECRFRAVVSAAAQDLGLGTRGFNARGNPRHFSATINHGNGANKGQLILYSGSGGGFTLRATSPSNLAMNATDVIRLVLVRNGPTFTCTAFNETQSVSLAPLSYTFPLQTATDPVPPNSGRPCIYPLQAGNVNIVSFSYLPTFTIGAVKALVIGDSKTAGYNTTANPDRFTNLLNVQYGGIEVMSGFGDEFTEFSRLISWIWNMKPKFVIFAGGSNDVRNGVTEAVIYSNLRDIVAACVAVNSTPVFLGMNENAINQSFLFTTARAMMGATNCIIVNPTRAADGIHLTTAGHLQVFNAIVAAIGSRLA
jgi:hypothetical protein